MSQPIIDAAYVRRVLKYDSETGICVWAERKNHPRLLGKPAGYINNMGYFTLTFLNRHFLAHRVIWLYVTGEWPTRHIDHIDGNKLNNRFSNLRDVSRFTNLQNMRGATKRNKLGLMGVCFHEGKYLMQIMANGVRYRRWGFETAEEAHQAYLAAKRKLHEGCTI